MLLQLYFYIFFAAFLFLDAQTAALIIALITVGTKNTAKSVSLKYRYTIV